MSLEYIQTPAFIHCCSPGQGRMAGASTSVNEFDGMVTGQHVYISAWTPLTDKRHKYILQEDNKCDKYVVNKLL